MGINDELLSIMTRLDSLDEAVSRLAKDLEEMLDKLSPQCDNCLKKTQELEPLSREGEERYCKSCLEEIKNQF